MIKNPVIFNGQVYPDVTSMCRAFKINVSNYRSRIRRGLTRAQALGVATLPPSHTEIFFKGKIYPSQKALQEAFDVSKGTFEKRRARGWTLEQSLGVAPPPPKKIQRPHRWNNKDYSLSELVAVHPYNLASSTISRRIRTGMPMSEVMGPARLVGTCKPVLIEGVLYESIAAAARAYGHTPELIRCRLHETNMDLETALLLPKHHDPFSDVRADIYGYIYTITVHETGLKYVGLAIDLKERKKQHTNDLANAHPIPGDLYGDMIRYGQTEFDMVVIDKGKSKRQLAELEKKWIAKLNTFKNGYNKTQGGIPVSYKGQLFPSIKFACKALGITVDPVRDRMRKGMSFQEAVDDTFSTGYFYDNQFFMDASRLAAHCNVDHNSLYMYLRTSDSVEDAIEKTIKLTEVGRRGLIAAAVGSKIEWAGNKYYSIPQACEAVNQAGILDFTLSAERIRNYKYAKKISAQEAFDSYLEGKVKELKISITINNVVYNSVRSACSELNISYAKVIGLTKNGMGHEDAVNQALKEILNSH
ncbi:GIY-YIG nuclease family protein [Vibrio parahaemolyticus]|nr:GIY-YIG nuclease family protein [Vibrio parahaemolyticus]